MRLIDANIFIYAIGRPHPYREPCRSLLSQLEDRAVEGNIDVELLQEILGFYWKRSRLTEGLALFDRLQLAFPDPLPITNAIISSARALLSSYPAIGPRDAIHAAAVIVHQFEGIISTDSGFDAIPGIKRFDPMEL